MLAVTHALPGGMTIFSSALLLFLIMDPLGNVPLFLAILRKVEPRRRMWVIVRENLFALATLVFFALCGPTIMSWLHIQEATLNIAGGLVLVLVALEMVFHHHGGIVGSAEDEGEPLIVPMAIPLISGPSTLAMVMFLATREPDRTGVLLVSISAAWMAGLVILLLSAGFHRILGDRGLAAIERLMGMVLLVVAVQMAITGIEAYVHRP